MNNESSPEGTGYTGKEILYRGNAVGFFDVQRAADALLRQGRKPSVAGIREQLGGGSPNTITPLLARYWQKLGERLAEGPESLERVPEALARVTELLWRRAMEEAKERLKVLQQPEHKPGALEELQTQIGKLSVALAEARAREGEQFSHLSSLVADREALRAEKAKLLALLNSAQTLLQHQVRRAARLKPERAKTPQWMRTKPPRRRRPGVQKERTLSANRRKAAKKRRRSGR